VAQWEIETVIRGGAIAPYTEDIIYTMEYHDWDRGANMAMQEVLPRLCYTYHGSLPPESAFRHFRRDDPGVLGIEPICPSATTATSWMVGTC
jgi:hypothetical protein